MKAVGIWQDSLTDGQMNKQTDICEYRVAFTDGQMDEQTFVIVESLLQLKKVSIRDQTEMVIIVKQAKNA